MDGELEKVGKNLQEIYSAVHDPCASDYNLVAFRDRLYSARGTLFGRIVVFYQSLLSLLLGYDYRFRNVQKALLATHELYKKQAAHIMTHVKSAEDLICKMAEAVDASMPALDDLNAKIEEFVQNTRPFLKIYRKGHPKVIQLFRQFCPEIAQNSTFSNKEVYKKSRDLHVMKHLIGVSRGSLPWHVLKSAAQGLALPDEQKHQLKQWVGQLNKECSSITCRQLDKAICALVHILRSAGEREGVPPVRVGNLQCQMLRHGCQFLLDPDPKHIGWRSHLHAGDILSIKERKITLGDPIGRKPPSEVDNTLIFSIRNDPSKIVVVRHNRNMLRMQQKLRKRAKTNSWGFKPLTYQEVHLKGLFAIAEMLLPVANDPNKIDIATRILSWLCKQEWTPTHFMAKYLMVTPTGEIVSTTECELGPFDFNALEQFAFDMSHNHHDHYRDIIERSNLLDQPAAKLYRDIILKGVLEYFGLSTPQLLLKYKTFTDKTVRELISENGINDEKVIERAHTLFEEAKQIMSQCLRELADQYEVPTGHYKQVHEICYNVLQQYMAVGRFWPSLSQQITPQVSAQLHLKPKNLLQNMGVTY